MKLLKKLKHSTTELLLVRHGQTDWNIEERIQGHLDVPLNKEGHRQAHKVAQELAKIEIAGIYASDLQRALNTAQALSILIQKPIIPLRALREMHAGHAQGLTQTEREFLYGEWRLWLTKLPFDQRVTYPEWPAGESKNDVFKRAYKSLTTIAQKHLGARVVVVTHSGVIHTLIGGLGHEEIAVPNCSIAYFSYNSVCKKTPLAFNKLTSSDEPSSLKRMSAQAQL